MAKKRLSFRVPEGLDAYALAEELRKAAQSQLASIELRGRRIDVYLYGDPVSIERSTQLMKTAYKEVMEKFKLTRGNVVIIPKSRVATVLGYPINLAMLKEALNLMKIRYDERGDSLVIAADYPSLLDLAKRLFENYVASKEYLGGSARRVASVLSVVLGEDIVSVCELAERLGLFKKVEGKYFLAANPEKVYSTIAELQSLQAEK